MGEKIGVTNSCSVHINVNRAELPGWKGGRVYATIAVAGIIHKTGADKLNPQKPTWNFDNTYLLDKSRIHEEKIDVDIYGYRFLLKKVHIGSVGFTLQSGSLSKYMQLDIHNKSGKIKVGTLHCSCEVHYQEDGDIKLPNCCCCCSSSVTHVSFTTNWFPLSCFSCG